MVHFLFPRLLLEVKFALTQFTIAMRMKDPLPTFSYLISEIKRRWPDLAYIHVIEPRQNEVYAGVISVPVDISGTNDPFRDIWAPRPFISCGAYADDRESGIMTAEEKGDIIAYGRPFIANVSSLYTLRCSADFLSTLSRISHIVSSTISLGTRATDLRITPRTQQIPKVTQTILSRKSSKHICNRSLHVVLGSALHRQNIVV
jgi:hypothetical protein